MDYRQLAEEISATAEYLMAAAVNLAHAQERMTDCTRDIPADSADTPKWWQQQEAQE